MSMVNRFNFSEIIGKQKITFEHVETLKNLMDTYVKNAIATSNGNGFWDDFYFCTNCRSIDSCSPSDIKHTKECHVPNIQEKANSIQKIDNLGYASDGITDEWLPYVLECINFLEMDGIGGMQND